MIAADICREYLKRFPNTPTLTLAKKIIKEHPALFVNVESCRSTLQRLQGKKGDKMRKRTQDKSLFNEHKPLNPFADIPKSSSQERARINIEGSRILFLSDIHFPYHNEKALNIALNYGKANDVDCIYLNGDVIDCYQLSSFERDPRKRQFSYELKQVQKFFEILRREFPKAHIYFKEGNHEERYWRFMRIKAPELLDIEAFSLSSLLKLDEFNIQYIPGRTKSNIGALSVFHGHEFGNSTFSPVNVARGLYMRAKANAICGHSHQTSEHTERDVNNKMVTTWSVGCLSELSPDYSPYNKWNHGFAFITSNGNEFTVQNMRIYKGKVM
jgi:predicted phosphodiesterase